MRIAIIGSGIAGLYSAWRLNAGHDVTVFEAKDYAGGHTHTVDAELDGQDLAVDTGFIVFNERNYPLFTKMLAELGVAHQASDMSFSFSCRDSGLEYRGGERFKGLFAQRRNLLRPSFLRMLRDIQRFNRTAAELVACPAHLSLGDYLDHKAFDGPMVDHYLLPMAGAIWSAEPRTILDFPASRFGSFFVNHGLLQVRNRVRWRTVSGGARQYVRAISAQLGSRLRLNTPVEWIQRLNRHVLVKAHGQPPQEFDAVVIACHSDQALRLLRDPAAAERDILGKIRYQANEAVLHADASLMPRRRRAWAAWNYHRLGATADGLASVTYNLSTLQNLPGRQPLLVTLNTSAAVDPGKILMRTVYDHPVFDATSLGAQQRRHEISGQRRTWYCGAYWGYGFHEDGAASAAAVCDDIEQYSRDQELPLQGTG